MNDFKDVALALARAKRVMVLTGAGISTASGIPDFRSRTGLYNTNGEVESVLSEHYFHTHPESFWKKFKQTFRLNKFSNFEPNYGHLFFSKLESEGKDIFIYTQNIDGLHQKAGNRNVLELHGTYELAHCTRCKKVFTLPHILNEDIPRCSIDHTILKPDVVLFGGPVKHLQSAYETICDTDVFLAIGTSLTVYPAREIPTYAANASNIVKVLINKEKTQSDPLFNYVFHQEINIAFYEINTIYENIK